MICSIALSSGVVVSVVVIRGSSRNGDTTSTVSGGFSGLASGVSVVSSGRGSV